MSNWLWYEPKKKYGVNVKNIALTWFDGKYDEEQAKRSCELQNLDWEKVLQHYGELYHESEAASNGY